MATLEEELKKGPISISCSVSDNYVQHLTVLAASLLHHASKWSFVFHVLTREISTESQAALQQMEVEYAPRCTFRVHMIEASCFEAFPLPIEHISQEMYYRFLLPNLLKNEKRTIYMDVDIVAMGDVSSLWEWDLWGYAMGGVVEADKEMAFINKDKTLLEYKRQIGLRPDLSYFNSGVLLMDLEQLRELDFEAKAMALTTEIHDRLAWPDQDVINVLLQGKILPLPPIYNAFSPRLIRRKKEIVLRHYASFTTKPWCYSGRNQSWYAYLRFLFKTPFRNRALAFIWAHVKGFFWYTTTKKGTMRGFFLSIPVYRKRVHK